MRSRNIAKSGFTLVELLVVISIIGVLVGLLLPAVLAARESARRMDCSNRMKQLGLAMANYESAFRRLPTLRLGSTNPNDPYARIGGLVMILPFLEQQPLFDEMQSSIQIVHSASSRINEGSSSNSAMFCPLPDTPGDNGLIKPWLYKLTLFRCPSDPKQESAEEMGYTNYAFCVADTIVDNASGTTRGMFETKTFRRIAEVTDGLSMTIFMSEIKVGGEMIEWLGDPELLTPCKYSSKRNCGFSVSPLSSPAPPQFFGRGKRWVDGAPIFTSFNTILPPGDVSANHRKASDLAYGNFAAGSYHASEGVNCVFGDGSVRFISSSIDCGDLTKPAPSGRDNSESPYGAWGGLGTINLGEIMDVNSL